MTRFLITGANGFIGTNLVTALRSNIQAPYEVALLDIAAPQIELQSNETWYNTSLLDEAAVKEVFTKAQPQIVINLAALTSTEPEYILSDYAVNMKGAEIIYQNCAAFGVDFLVHTSSQFVNQAPGFPTSDIDYAPHTIYGESKVISEQALRNGNYPFNWCIIRPTNIWGPFHLRYPYEFWKVLKEGKYFHPGSKPVIRSYGYVGNICWQITELIKRRNEAAISKQVFYVGDEPMNMYDWANEFSLAITKKKVRVVPTFFVYTLALAGTVLRNFKIKFPITLSRYKSMTTDNPAPMEKTLELLGAPPFNLKQGVAETVSWLELFWRNKN
ncbi:MAG: NAD(P)-dependent oxidoreductase [Sediminibacterium sp.]|uniref:NAD-dependent epimerase/dehydratase family protein n=1 Tax=Sediminibacterium sp. TaxID=1917865 RepID=UPI002722BA98|nr:NAD(P)-dependent oxidoreductase [Sediminibacterium sp.]MDO8997119.1 NAD(P)-dependent oxidoreductase [Sediminibacterium sp.]